MKKCKDNRDTCAQVVYSSCVRYSGEVNEIIDEDQLGCPPNINDVIEQLLEVVKTIKENTDIKEVDSSCLSDCPTCDAKDTHKDLFEYIIKALCSITDRLKTVEEIDIMSTKFNVNLSCFNNPCINNSNNEHTLIEVISLFANELCLLKNKK